MNMRVSIAALCIVLLMAAAFSRSGASAQQAAPPSARVDPGSVDFGNQVAKRASKPQRITVTNTGGKKLYVNSAVLNGDDKQDFTLAHDTCTGATIGAGKSCVIDVVFTPSATERRKAAIVLTTNSVESPVTIPLIGVGINSADVPPRSGGR